MRMPKLRWPTGTEKVIGLLRIPTALHGCVRRMYSRMTVLHTSGIPLAANFNEKRLGRRDDLFTETLSGNEIKEAQDMVINWKPGEYERELSLGIGNEQ